MYYEPPKPGKIIEGKRYRLQLIRLSLALREKRPEANKRHDKVILQHGYARLHMAVTVKDYMKTLKYEILPTRCMHLSTTWTEESGGSFFKDDIQK